MFWIAGAALLVYVVGSYYLMYRSLKRSAGPAGLGWFALPLAPLAGPMFLWMNIKEFARKVAH